jgi:hypothetical protein
MNDSKQDKDDPRIDALMRLAKRGLLSDVPEVSRPAIEKLLEGRDIVDAEKIISTFVSINVQSQKPGVAMTNADDVQKVSIGQWAKQNGLYS